MASKGKADGQSAVLYAAKSTDDVRGSIPTQLADCRELAEREGREVVAEFSDEAASAYSGNRGPDLERAMRRCEELGAALVVQHSDRLARGDGRHAKHLLHYSLWAVERDLKILSVQDPQTFGDLLYAAVTGQRNHEDSQRKGLATAAGHRRRWEQGKRLGHPIRDGYRLAPVLDTEGSPTVAKDGRVVREVQLDPERAKLWRRIFDLFEAGHTPGEIRKLLNAEAVSTGRGNPWRTRDIRRGLLDDFYAGRAHAYGQTLDGDHEPLIDPERWERLAAAVPTGRTGGQPPARDDFLLRGIARCGLCGSKLHVRGDHRRYVCAAVRQGHGTCDAPNIPAEIADTAVLDHLEHFISDVEDWLATQAKRGDEERESFADTLETQRRELRKLDVRAQRANQLADRALDEGDDATATAALRKADTAAADRDALADAVAAGDQRLAEWPTVPDVDAALDTYSELRDAIHGRLSGSQTVQELRAHLRAVLWVALLDYQDGLYATFAVNGGTGLPLGITEAGHPTYGSFPDDRRAHVCLEVLSQTG